MFERIYALLLRLYPSHFHEAYGEAALQLFRDCDRDETGFFPRLWLWLDLLTDLAISLPREYLHIQPAFVAASAQQGLESKPGFHLLERDAPGLGALLSGGALALATLSSFLALIGHVGTYRPLHARSNPLQLVDSLGRSSQIPQLKPQYTASARNQATIDSGRLDTDERQRVVDRVIANLKQYYFDRNIAQKTADALLAHEKKR